MAAKSKDKKKKRGRIAQRALHALEIPQEALGSVCAVTLWGNSYARMENHRGVVELGGETIRLRSADGVVKFSGENLLLELLDGNLAQIRGNIRTIEYLV